MKIAFIHPDLGIAERLVVDAAVVLEQRGHDVTIFTSHYDPTHCFEETRNLKIVVLGNTIIPTSVGNRFFIVCSILRQLHLCMNLIRECHGEQYDVFIVDQLSACIPVIRSYLPGRILFYCHFPDQLLAQRESFLRKLYRLPFDKFEEWTTGQSDVIVVNSKFTRSVFRKTFSNLKKVPEVIYPCVEINSNGANSGADDDGLDEQHRPFFLSINRFERKKNIELAILSYALSEVDATLVVAGGYDTRVKENVEYLEELVQTCDKLGLPTSAEWPKGISSPPSPSLAVKRKNLPRKSVIFLPSVDSERKDALLKNTVTLLYTPTNEHFGIVPLEAMRKGTTVLATNTGGPLETIVDGVTGWTVPAKPQAWASRISEAFNMSPKDRAEMSQQAIRRACAFSREAMGEQFEQYLEMARVVGREPDRLYDLFLWFKAFAVVIVVACVVHFI